MKNNILYAILDNKAEFYRGPYCARSRAEALRDFQRVANETETQIGRHPEDFTLYVIGEFNDITGEVIPHAHASLGKAVDYVQKNQLPTHITEMEGRN